MYQAYQPRRTIYSDIKCFAWPLWSPWAGVYARDKPKAVQAWQDRIVARAAVQKGLVRDGKQRSSTVRD